MQNLLWNKKIKLNRITTVTILLFILLSVYLYADDSIIADFGKNIKPEKTNDIEMISENVIIKPFDSKDENNATFVYRKAYVTATFWFKNTTTKSIETTVGFPGNDADPRGFRNYSLSNFTAIVNGKINNIEEKKEGLGDDRYRTWYSWRMIFPANSVTKVKNSYYCRHSTDSGYDPWYLKYTLSTGSNWKGHITTATVKVIYKNEDDLIKRIVDIKPNGWIKRNNEIFWVFRNIEPKETDNIVITEENLSKQSLGQRPHKLLFKNH